MSLLLLVLPGCRRHGFTIDGQIDGVPERQVTVTYVGDKGVTEATVALGQGNAFTYQGSSEQYTLLDITDPEGQLVARVVVCDGDHITVNSDGAQLPTIDASGNRPTEQWMRFRRDNQDAFLRHDRALIDSLIERQIKSHPDQLLSTVLLAAEYGRQDDVPHLTELLQAIAPEARPQRLVMGLELLIEQYKPLPNRLKRLQLYDSDRGMTDVKHGQRQMVLFFWSRRNLERQACVDTLRNLARRRGHDLDIIDVLVDTDTTRWGEFIARDATSWGHMWAPGGLMGQPLRELHLTHTPMLLLADSAANITYAGSDPAQLIQHITHAE